jgi:hypothetical protein
LLYEYSDRHLKDKALCSSSGGLGRGESSVSALTSDFTKQRLACLHRLEGQVELGTTRQIGLIKTQWLAPSHNIKDRLLRATVPERHAASMKSNQRFRKTQSSVNKLCVPNFKVLRNGMGGTVLPVTRRFSIGAGIQLRYKPLKRLCSKPTLCFITELSLRLVTRQKACMRFRVSSLQSLDTAASSASSSL